jgi:hypothetical protein
VGYGNHGRFGNRRMTHERGFEGDGADPLAPRLHQILRPIGELDAPAFADGHDVSGLEPAVVSEAIVTTLRVVVARGDPRAPDLELAHGLTIPRCESLLGAGANLDERLRHALFGAVAELVVERRVLEIRGDGAHRSERGHFGHAPGVEQ